MKILVDSNILMLADSGLDLSEFRGRMCILSPCLKELEMLSQFKGKRGRAARVALSIVRAYEIEVIGAQGDCDPSLLEAAKKGGFAVATNDRKLIKALSDNRIEVLTPRNGRLAGD